MKPNIGDVVTVYDVTKYREGVIKKREVTVVQSYEDGCGFLGQPKGPARGLRSLPGTGRVTRRAIIVDRYLMSAHTRFAEAKAAALKLLAQDQRDADKVLHKLRRARQVLDDMEEPT